MPTYNYTVGPSGRDYTSLQAAWDANKAGPDGDYVITIDAGTYTQFNASGDTGTKTWLFAAADGDAFEGVFQESEPWIYPRIFGIILNAANPITLRGLVSYGPAVGSRYVVLFNICTVENCAVTGKFVSLFTSAIGFHILADDATLRNCVVHAFGRPASTCYGIYVRPASGGTARLYHCTVRDIGYYSGYSMPATTYGIYIDTFGDVIVRNCAVVGLTGTTTHCVQSVGTGTEHIDYNGVSDAMPGDAGAHAVTSVPDSEFAGANDCRLAASASLLPGNAGSLVGYAYAPTTDIEGDSIGPDIGCDTLLSDLTGTIACPGEEAITGIAGRVEVSGAVACPGVASDASLGDVRDGVLTCPGVASEASIVGSATAGAVLTCPGELATAAMSGRVLVRGSIACAGVDSEASLSAAVATAYYVDARGLYRVFDEAEYRFYRSQAGPPVEGSEPWATAASLPATPTDTFANGTWYLSMSYFNGVYDSGFLALGDDGQTYLTLVVTDTGALPPPRGPASWQLIPQGNGVVQVAALLYAKVDAAFPDEWAIAYTVDGSDPPADAPDLTSAMTSSPVQQLLYDLPAQADGVTLKVRLQTRRNDGTAEVPVWVYSVQSAVLSLAIDATAPGASPAAASWPGELELEG